jgi:hypothetical protein
VAKHIDNRTSEIEDLLYDGIDDIISEFAPFLSEEPGANYNTNHGYRNTVRGRMHKRLMDNIWSGMAKQLDNYEKEVDDKIDELIEARDTYVSDNIDLKEENERLDKENAELREENRLFREGKGGMVYGKEFNI